MGHEGGHAVLLTDDGGAYFVGTAKRGEDGDASAPWKGRRAPKPVKPKKMTKMDAVAAPIVGVVANSGTSALITRDGAVYMFGKVHELPKPPPTYFKTKQNKKLVIFVVS